MATVTSLVARRRARVFGEECVFPEAALRSVAVVLGEYERGEGEWWEKAA